MIYYLKLLEELPSAQTLSASVTEAATATDTVAGGYTVAQSESGTATDTPATTAVFASSDTEAASATDTETTTAVFASSDSEAATAAETETTTAVFAASPSEAASAADTISAQTQQNLSVSVSEPASALDITDGINPNQVISVSGGDDMRAIWALGQARRRPYVPLRPRPTVRELIADIVERVEAAPTNRKKRAAAADAARAVLGLEELEGRRDLEDQVRAAIIAEEADAYVTKLATAATIARIARLRADDDHRERAIALLLAVL